MALITVCLFSLLALTAPARAAVTDGDKQFLAAYEKARACLAADDLASAKKAGRELGDSGAALAKSDTLQTARAEFGKLSDRALTVAKDQAGYHVLHCPMLKKDWVQTSKEVSNPYGGKGWRKRRVDGANARDGKDDEGDGRLEEAKDADFDKKFLVMMSEHHQGAVAMSKLVADRTDRADLQQLANKIIKDQTKEIEQMKGWEKSWFDSAH
ncbi:MAG: DUF305 domain-containing protein [Chthoniobacterales bacterium]